MPTIGNDPSPIEKSADLLPPAKVKQKTVSSSSIDRFAVETVQEAKKSPIPKVFRSIAAAIINFLPSPQSIKNMVLSLRKKKEDADAYVIDIQSKSEEIAPTIPKEENKSNWKTITANTYLTKLEKELVDSPEKKAQMYTYIAEHIAAEDPRLNNSQTTLDLDLIDIAAWETITPEEQQKKMEGLQALLKLGAEPKASNQNKVTALLTAIAANDYQATKLLLDAGSLPAVGPALGYIALQQTSDPEMRRVLLSKDPELQEYACQNKLLVSRFALQGEAAKFQGIDVATGTREFIASVNNYQTHFPDAIPPDVSKALQRVNLDLNDVDDKIKEIDEGRLVAVETFYQTDTYRHGVGLVIFGNYLIKCNRGHRGVDELSGITIYKIGNKENLKLALETIAINQTVLDNTKGQDYFEGNAATPGTLAHDLGLVKVGYMAHKDQSIGNCCFASSKLLLEACLVAKKLPQALQSLLAYQIRSQYKDFTSFDRYSGAVQLMDAINNLPKEQLAELERLDLMHPVHLVASLVAKLKFYRAEQADLFDMIQAKMKERPDIFDEKAKEIIRLAEELGRCDHHEAFVEKLMQIPSESFENRWVCDIVQAKLIDQKDLLAFFALLKRRVLPDDPQFNHKLSKSIIADPIRWLGKDLNMLNKLDFDVEKSLKIRIIERHVLNKDMNVIKALVTYLKKNNDEFYLNMLDLACTKNNIDWQALGTV